MGEHNKTSLNWGMISHVAGLALYIGIPLGNILAPLAVWLLKRHQDPFVNEQGREAVNFNISFTLYGLVAGILCYVLIGYVLLPLVLLVHVALIIQATIKANKGESVRYPFTLRFVN